MSAPFAPLRLVCLRIRISVEYSYTEGREPYPSPWQRDVTSMLLVRFAAVIPTLRYIAVAYINRYHIAKRAAFRDGIGSNADPEEEYKDKLALEFPSADTGRCRARDIAPEAWTYKWWKVVRSDTGAPTKLKKMERDAGERLWGFLNEATSVDVIDGMDG